MYKYVVPERVLNGGTTDVYFKRTQDILKAEGINPVVVMEVFPGRDGILCGIKEDIALLKKILPKDAEVWALDEGEPMSRKEVVLRIKAPYQSFGLYETAICGYLSSSSGWATAAHECVAVAGGIPVTSFGARHVHPNIAAEMDYAAVVGGCNGCATILGAQMAGCKPSGTIPHALVLVMGDTLKATKAFDKHMPKSVARVALVDTFTDEALEAVRVSEALGKHLAAIRIDTPKERGGVTMDLVRELRARLDQAGMEHVGIFVSGGFSTEKIKMFTDNKVPVVGYGVGSQISSAPPIEFTADIHEIDGKPIAKRGRIPGVTENPRLKRVI